MKYKVLTENEIYILLEALQTEKTFYCDGLKTLINSKNYSINIFFDVAAYLINRIKQIEQTRLKLLK